MEFVVTSVDALETPRTLIDPTTGKIFPMVTLRLEVIQPSGKQEELILHFAPQHLHGLLPKLGESTQQALALATAPSTDRPH